MRGSQYAKLITHPGSRASPDGRATTSASSAASASTCSTAAVGHRAGLELVEAGAAPALARLVPVAVGIQEQESHVELRAALDFGGVAALAYEVAMPADFLVVEPDAKVPLARSRGRRRRNDGCGRGDAREHGDEGDGDAHHALLGRRGTNALVRAT